jgi:environmental stress-induced protein Ves
VGRARVIRSHEYVRMPWKNGGGETAEIAVGPPGAALAQFDWRISMARVATDGPFSNFPGVDRTLAIVAGAGLRLTVRGQSPVDLREDSLPLAFPGDASTHAVLLGGEILDFNVMTRRARHEHSVRRLHVAASTAGTPLPSANLVFCQDGAVDVHHGNQRERLERHDSLLREDATAWHMSSESGATLLVVSIEEA